MSDIRCFISYSRADAGCYLDKFYNDLCENVASKFGEKNKAKFVYMDSSHIELGDEWEESLIDALQSCDIFVSIYSRGYFGSDYCGKEFSIFKKRMDLYNSTGAQCNGLILPVLWENPETYDIPTVIGKIQYDPNNFDKIYQQEGLRYLLKLQQYKDEYEKFIDKLSKQIFKKLDEFSKLRAENKYTLPKLKDKITLKDTINGFAVSNGKQNVVPELNREQLGPNTAKFVFIAGNSEELKVRRKQTDGYGFEGGRDWKPYYPEYEKAIGNITLAVALELDLFYETLVTSVELLEEIGKAEKTNTIVIIIIDPWSIEIEPYSVHINSIDKYAFINCALLIPWNESDIETKNNRSMQSNIRKIFAKIFVLNNMYIRDSLTNKDALHSEMVMAITEIRRNMFQRAQILRPIDSTITSLPIVTGTKVGQYGAN